MKEEPPAYGGGTPRKLTPDQHRDAIAAAARELNDLRERWLNPPEWTETRYLEFPGTVGGPWDRYIDRSTLTRPDGHPLPSDGRTPRVRSIWQLDKGAVAPRLIQLTLWRIYEDKRA